MTAPAQAMTPRGQQTTGRFSVRIPNERTFYAVLGFVGLLIAWQLASNAGIIKKILMSSPIDIARTAVLDFTTGAIWPHLTISAQEWILGFLIAIAFGIPFGFALGYAHDQIERLSGFDATAPISGQRAMRASTLRDLIPFADSFGMEIGMTVDAVRAGHRVKEIELPLEHRATHRTLKGFLGAAVVPAVRVEGWTFTGATEH